MNNFRHLILLLSILFFVPSCQEIELKDDKKIETALLLSGNNRPELEKVLKYYSANEKDSLKLRAAEFLIGNMLYHRSMCGECIENQIKMIDTLYRQISLPARSVYYMIPARIDSLKASVKTEADIEKMTADLLIKNIEYSFDVWENSIYEPRTSFEDFCEYILPYKHSEEPLILWKDSLDFKSGIARDLSTYELNMTMANTYYSYCDFSQDYLPYTQLFSDKVLYSASDNAKYRASIDLAYMRSNGIPTTIDFVPFSNTTENNYWTATINRKYIDAKYAYVNKNFSSKVFRKTYSLNPTPADKNNFVPDFIRNPYNKDVTEIYQNVSTVEYDFGNISSNVKYAYLAIFYEGEWCEVSWSELTDGKASFKKMGRDVIYMPLYYDGEHKICAKNAVHLDRDGKIKKIGIAHNERQSITMERISAYTLFGEYLSKSILGGRIIACNTPENLKFDTLTTITHSKYNSFDTVNVDSDKKYKCWLIALEQLSYLSELQFFNKNGEQMKGQIVWFDQNNTVSYKTSSFTKLFDNDILTDWGMNTIVGIVLKEPTAISYVRYMPQNDRCGIMPGNEYELFYCLDGAWVLWERKVAADYKIEFSDVPVNALFWLHDKGKKCDERPFTIVNGRIKFW